MNMKVMVCGVDCNPGDENCNGYCIGKAEHPREATPEQRVESARRTAHEKLREAQKAWYAYYGECDVGEELTWAAGVYEIILNATRR